MSLWDVKSNSPPPKTAHDYLTFWSVIWEWLERAIPEPYCVTAPVGPASPAEPRSNMGWVTTGIFRIPNIQSKLGVEESFDPSFEFAGVQNGLVWTPFLLLEVPLPPIT